MGDGERRIDKKGLDGGNGLDGWVSYFYEEGLLVLINNYFLF